MKTNRAGKMTAVSAALIALLLSVTACSGITDTAKSAPGTTTAADTAQVTLTAETPAVDETQTKGVYTVITAEKAKKIIDAEANITILDVRELSEYQTGHLPNAQLLPVGEIEQKAATDLPDKNAKILVYCRSGRRSKIAAETLIGLGYTNVIDFGGIINWPYDVVTN